jgi:hypothetical protein
MRLYAIEARPRTALFKGPEMIPKFLACLGFGNQLVL